MSELDDLRHDLDRAIRNHVADLNRGRKWLGNVGDAISQLLNVLLIPGDTDANESISGRAYRMGWDRTRKAINAVFGHDHCHRAYLKDIARAKRLLGL